MELVAVLAVGVSESVTVMVNVRGTVGSGCARDRTRGGIQSQPGRQAAGRNGPRVRSDSAGALQRRTRIHGVDDALASAPEVLTLSAATEMVMLRLSGRGLAVGVSESVAVTVKVSVPTKVPVGVPEITPVAAFKMRPRETASGDRPGDGRDSARSFRVWLVYATPTEPPASDVVVTLSVVALIAMLRFALAVLFVGDSCRSRIQ